MSLVLRFDDSPGQIAARIFACAGPFWQGDSIVSTLLRAKGGMRRLHSAQLGNILSHPLQKRFDCHRLRQRPEAISWCGHWQRGRFVLHLDPSESDAADALAAALIPLAEVIEAEDFPMDTPATLPKPLDDEVWQDVGGEHLRMVIRTITARRHAAAQVMVTVSPALAPLVPIDQIGIFAATYGLDGDHRGGPMTVNGPFGNAQNAHDHLNAEWLDLENYGRITKTTPPEIAPNLVELREQRRRFDQDPQSQHDQLALKRLFNQDPEPFDLSKCRL